MTILYPSVVVARQSFAGVKRQTIPNQSLTIRQILQRYVRHEPLPLAHDGLYEDRFGDLEKISHADITEQMDRIAEIKAMIKRVEKYQSDLEVKAKADALAAAVAAAVPPVVPTKGETVKNPPS